MVKARDVIAAGMLYGAAWGVIGAGVGEVVEIGHFNDAADLVVAAKTDVADTEQQIVTLEGDVKTFTSKVGETCVVALKPYRFDGALADVPESDAVSDIIGAPNQACGDNPTEVRSVLRTDRTQQKTLADARDSLPQKRAKVTSREKTYRDDKNFSGWVVGGAVMALIGGAWGAGFSSWNKYSFYRDVIKK